MTYELKSLSFGETIGRAFNLFIDNFIPLFLICLILQIPFYFLLMISQMNNFTSILRDSNLSVMTSLSYVLLIIVAYLLIQSLQTGVIVKYIANKYLGEKIVLRDFLQSIKSSILPLSGLTIIFGFVLMLGLLVFIIPGIILLLGFILSTQVLVIEKQKIIGSMKRSWNLTKGMRLRIFFWLLIIFIITYIINSTAKGIVTSLFNAFDLSNFWIIMGISFFIQSLTAPLMPCILVLIYFNAKIDKEGFAIEHLAEQFTQIENTETQGLS